MVPLQHHLWQWQPEEDPVLWLRLHSNRIEDLRPAALPW